jgi:glycosyltransferase involved in cell wall biosynthesis
MVVVSTVIPYFSHGRFLHAAVQSALADFGDEAEVIVVNDGSAERHSRMFLHRAASLGRNISIISKPNGGRSSARNAGLRAATAPFIQFLDSDDVLIPGKLRRQMAHLMARPDLAVSVVQWLLTDEWLTSATSPSDTIGQFSLSVRDFWRYWERGLTIPIHCALFRRSALGDLSFDERLEAHEDWVFWCALSARRPGGVGYLPVAGAMYRMHEANTVRNKSLMGDTWWLASRIISETLPERERPAFIASADAWHQREYRGARLPSRAQPQPGKFPGSQQEVARAAPQPELALVRESGTGTAEGARFSVVVPISNHSDHLSLCLGSLIRQKAKLEIIAIDDACTDSGVSTILDSFDFGRMPFRIYRCSRNMEISWIHNQAARLARGEFLAFVDCDDWLREDALELVSAQMLPGADYVFSDRYEVDSAGELVHLARYGGYPWLHPSGDIAEDLTLGMVASHLKVIRRSAYLTAGGSSAEFAGVQDWDLALRMARSHAFQYVPVPIYYHRRHSGSMTDNLIISQLQLVNRVRRIALSSSRRPSRTHEVTAIGSRAELRGLVRRIRQGFRLTYRNSTRLDHTEIDLLREFNSLFDVIDVQDEASAALMMGFLWSVEALRPGAGRVS